MRRVPWSWVLVALAAGLLGPSPAGATGWTNVSAGAGGAFTCVGAGLNGVILVGSDISGAYRSTDRGLSWTNIGYLNGGLERTHVNSIAFDPELPEIVYLGAEGGLYRSADAGVHFSMQVTEGFWSAVAIAPSRPDWVYAVSHSAYNTTDPRVYRSTDRGVTWAYIGSLPAGTRVLKLAVRPNDHGHLFALSGYERLMSGVQPRRALYVSSDGGVTWTDAHGDSTNHGMTGNPWDAAYDPEHPDTIYATSVVGSGNPDLSSNWSGYTWRGHQAGGTWDLLSTHTGAILARRGAAGGPVTLTTIDVGRDGPACTECGTFSSSDAGVTWTRLSDMTGWGTGWMGSIAWSYNTATSGVCKTLGQDLSDPAAVFWVTPQFIWMSSDAGASFVQMFTDQVSPGYWQSRGIDNVAPAALAASSWILYAGFYDLGIWRSPDAGTSWQATNDPAFTGAWSGRGGNCMTILTDPARLTIVWASQGEKDHTAQLIRNNAAGAPGGWTATSGIPTGYINGLSLDPQSPVDVRTLYATSNGDVYKSMNDGQSWFQVFDCDSCYVTAASGSTVFAGGQKGLWRSLDAGVTWSEINSSVFHLGWSSYAPASGKWNGPQGLLISGGAVYVTIYGKNRGLYKSANNGATWTRILADDFGRAIHQDAYGALYFTSSSATQGGGVGSSGSTGIQISLDAGATWQSITGGLPWPFAWPVATIPWFNSTMMAIVGTPGSGLWRAQLVNGGVLSVPPRLDAGLRAAGFRPNPAGQHVTIAFSLPAPGAAWLEVFDIAGRRLIHREVGSMGPGDHVLPLEMSLAPGIYIVRLEQGGHSVTARSAVVR